MDENIKKIIVRWIIGILVAGLIALGISFKISTSNYRANLKSANEENQRIGELLRDSEARIIGVLSIISDGTGRIDLITGGLGEGIQGTERSVAAIQASLDITKELAEIVTAAEKILREGPVD